MSLDPFVHYLNAREALQRGDRATAIGELEQALGSPAGNLVIEREVEHLLDHRSLPGEVALGLVRSELRKRPHVS